MKSIDKATGWNGLALLSFSAGLIAFVTIFFAPDYLAPSFYHKDDIHHSVIFNTIYALILYNPCIYLWFVGMVSGIKAWIVSRRISWACIMNTVMLIFYVSLTYIACLAFNSAPQSP